LAAKKVSDPDWTANEKAAAQYCGDKIPSQLTVDPASNVFPKIKETVIPVASGDKWRYAYETFGSLPKCQKMAIRLCGGWCKEAIKVAGEAEPAGANRMSTELGQLLTAANDTQADVSGQVSITRLGFRKNLTTGRFVQTVIIKNNGSSPMPSPLSLVLNSLTGGTLYNASGTTAAGPYVSVPVGGDSFQLTAGQSISLDLEFTDPANQAITYTTQVLALSVSDACK
jgi:hypothetical protein